jgi:hypothetical protein
MKYIFLALVALYTRPCFANWASSGFTSYQPSSPKSISEELEEAAPSTMLPERSMDTLGLCQGFAPTRLLQEELCIENKKYCTTPANPLSCKPENIISPVGIAAHMYADDPDGNLDRKDGTPDLILYGGGKSPLQILKNAAQNASFMPESCYPFDQLVNKYGSMNDALKPIVERLKKNYALLHENKKTEGDVCIACQIKSDLNDSFNIKIDVNKISQLSQDKKTFNSFIYDVFLGGCKEQDIKFDTTKGMVAVDTYPTSDTRERQKDKEIEKKLFDTIKTNKRSIMISELCLNGLSSAGEKCNDPHTAVITGTRQICKKNDPLDCRYSFRINNSWGKDWMDSHDNGWVDADKLMASIDTTKMGAFAWLTHDNTF